MNVKVLDCIVDLKNTLDIYSKQPTKFGLICVHKGIKELSVTYVAEKPRDGSISPLGSDELICLIDDLRNISYKYTKDNNAYLPVKTILLVLNHIQNEITF